MYVVGIVTALLSHSQITGTTTVGEVVERVATQKALPPNNYALYLVLGDSESQRVLGFSEKLLAVLYSTGSDNFLCLKPNTFAETLVQFVSSAIQPHAQSHGVGPSPH